MSSPDPEGSSPDTATWATLVPVLGPALLVVGKLMAWLIRYRQEHPKPHRASRGG